MQAFEEFSLRLPDGYHAYARFWPPTTEPRGAVLYHHGIQSHCGWFEASAIRLSQGGFAVLQFDRRGSGRNTEARGHAASADQLIDDARAAGDALRQKSGFATHHVVGVSWGGKLAVAAHVTHPEHARSLTLVTPGIYPRDGATKAEKARIGFSMLYNPQQSFDIPLNDPHLFTSNPQWAEFFRTDPLTLRQCTAGFYLASRRMDKIIARLASSRAVPVHLLLAEDEHIVDNEATAALIRGLHWPRCRITTYEHARHSLEFEEIRESYWSDIMEFIRAA
jgi:alpha-beta hydrolase superfamily lysophospholipase